MKFFTLKSGDNTLVGSRHIGDGSKDTAVVIVHGYLSANRIGPYRMYLQIANLLNEKGYDVFRVDLAGCGESTDNGTITLDSFYENFTDVLKYVGNSFKKVILIGHCLGANMVIYQNAIDKTASVIKCIGISPTPLNEKNLLKMFSKEQLEQAEQYHGFERRGLYVDQSFLGGLSNYDVFEKAIKKNDNLLIFIPENDAYVDVDELKGVCDRAHAKSIILPNADHHVLNRAAREKMFNDILGFLGE